MLSLRFANPCEMIIRLSNWPGRITGDVLHPYSSICHSGWKCMLLHFQGTARLGGGLNLFSSPRGRGWSTEIDRGDSDDKFPSLKAPRGSATRNEGGCAVPSPKGLWERGANQCVTHEQPRSEGAATRLLRGCRMSRVTLFASTELALKHTRNKLCTELVLQELALQE